MKKQLITLCITIFGFLPLAQAKIYIDINEASNRAFPIAVNYPVTISKDPKLMEAVDIFDETLRKNLEVMGVFRLISPKSFLEVKDKVGKLKDNEIDFAPWKQIEAQALVKGAMSIGGENVIIEMYLHDVIMGKQILAKRYVGKLDQAREMAHKFGNALVEALIGEMGVFDTQIAFVCTPKKQKELCLMNFNGWNYRKVTDHKTIVLSPAWDPISNAVYYTAFTKKEKPQLYLYQIDRKKILMLTEFKGSVIGLAFDPITKNLVTTLTKDDNAELYLLDRYGAEQKRLTNHRAIDVSASFSPDGKELVFVSDRDGSPQIYKMILNPKRGEDAVKRLTFKGKNNVSPKWSPKGDKIAFAGMDTDKNFDVFIMDADGSNMKRLTYDSKHNEEPTWAPDGNFIAFASTRSGKSQIWMMRPNGRMQTQLTFKDWDHYMPAWERK